MADKITILEFKELLSEMATSRCGIASYFKSLKQEFREDKYLREEYLPILAVTHYKGCEDAETIELGEETAPWDARLNGSDILEVVQALPSKEHEIRKSIAGTQFTEVVVRTKVPRPKMAIQIEHAGDHFQFPQVIVDAINKKHDKHYSDNRTLVVAFDGDYSNEDDKVVEEWLDEIRKQTDLGYFKEILLVEVSRLKVFPVV